MKEVEQDRLLREVWARASFPFERLSGHPSPPVETVDRETLERRKRDWERNLDGGGAARLARLLGFEGLRPEDLDRALGDPPPPAGPPPAWATTLERALELGPRLDRAEAPTQGDAVPFEEALFPFAAALGEQLTCARLAATAIRDWKVALVSVLSYWAAPGLYAEFSASNGQPARLAALLDRAAGIPAPRDRYLRFVEHLVAGGWWDVVRRRPVLGRLLGQITSHWIEAGRELLGRLEHDLDELERAFNDGRPLGLLAHIDPTASDPHRGGRRVARLSFESGATIVYKPRGLAMEVRYNALLGWLNTAAASLLMKTLSVVDRGSHGWVEHVEQADCADPAAVARYYRRAGQLLCLAFALDGTDCHYENLIAAGEYPVLVDPESLLHHRGGFERPLPEPSAQGRAGALVAYSVLRTGLLPTWQLTRDGDTARDVSGLVAGGTTEQVPTRRWLDVNTDRMELGTVQVALAPEPNLPRISGEPEPVERHVGSLLAGFRSMYELLEARRDALLAPDGPLAGFSGLHTRILFRPTDVYGGVMLQLRDAVWRLADGADAGLTYELLGRPYLSGDTRPEFRSLLASERRALYRFDVPVFTASVSDDSISLEDGTAVSGFFAGASIDAVRERLAGLDRADLDAQSDLIRSVLLPRDPVGESARGTGRHGEPARAPGIDDFIGTAELLAEDLGRRAIHGRDGSVTWIGPQLIGHSGRVVLRPLGPGLYDGLAGISLFLASLFAVTGSESARALARSAWLTVAGELRALDDPLSILGIGGGVGLGSLLYAAAEIDRHLAEDSVGDLVRWLGPLDPAAIGADPALDVLTGAAGAILGLLAVREGDPLGHALELADACGRRLLDARVPAGHGGRAWPSAEGPPLTGFSHGAAGISYALLRLFDATSDDVFREAAEDGIAYERSLFDAAARNWPDLRPEAGGTDERPAFAQAWCHGGPGIGLARLGGLTALDTPEIRADISAALASTRELLGQLDGRQDHLCCGNAGRIELLAAGADRLERPELMTEARARCAEMLAVAGGQQHLRFNTLLPADVYVPGLFTGAAGIGYELLRLVRPDLVGSVLLWEARV